MKPCAFKGFLALVLIMPMLASAQDTGPQKEKVLLRYDTAGSYRLTERSNWARYDNGKYTGHVYREVRGSFSPDSSQEYRGLCYVLEETLRDLRTTAQAVDTVIPVSFRIGTDGSFTAKEDRGYPSLRGFPAFPAEAVAVGQKWTARFTRAVDPANTGVPVFLPLIAEFEYRGEEVYKGLPVRRIFAKYATRYRSGSSARTRANFTEATGSHDVDILIHAKTGNTVLIRDRLDETFVYPDKNTVRFKGFTLVFTEGSSPSGRSDLVAKLKEGSGTEKPAKPLVKPDQPAGSPGDPSFPAPEQSGPAPGPELTPYRDPPGQRVPEAPFELADAGGVEGGPPTGITVEETDAGIRLSVRDLRFAPDSDQILPEEEKRLEILARSLKKADGKSFLVEGHTADVGKAKGEAELSKRRAKRIVDELAARGISAERFIYTGWGGTKPIAPNDSDEGRAKNRRVEITILD